MPVYWAPWPGKSMPSLPGAGADGKEAPSGVLQAVSGVLREHGQGVGAERCQVGPVPFDHQRQTAGRGGIEGGPRASAAMARRSGQACSAADRRQGRSPGSRHRPRKRAGSGRCRPSRPLLLAGCVLFEDAWKLEPPKPKALTAARRGCAAAGEPGALLGGDVEGGLALRNFSQRLLHLDRRGEHLVVQGQGGLDQPGRSGRRLGVADLRLDRAEGAPRAGRLRRRPRAGRVTSTASPTLVPVPWASTRSMLSGVTPAR